MDRRQKLIRRIVVVVVLVLSVFMSPSVLTPLRQSDIPLAIVLVSLVVVAVKLLLR